MFFFLTINFNIYYFFYYTFLDLGKSAQVNMPDMWSKKKDNIKV